MTYSIRPELPNCNSNHHAFRMLNIRWIGQLEYNQALFLQRSLFKSKFDYLLLLEHPPVYTFGLRYQNNNIFKNVVDSSSFLNVASAITDRGGDVTFHGPGQLVGYPIITIGPEKAKIKSYVNLLEEALIKTLERLNVKDVKRLEGKPGIYLQSKFGNLKKIASIGIRAKEGRVMHGFALNNTVDLNYFKSIIPCGLQDVSMTSLLNEGIKISKEDLINEVIASFKEVFADTFNDVNYRHVADDLDTYKNIDPEIVNISTSDSILKQQDQFYMKLSPDDLLPDDLLPDDLLPDDLSLEQSTRNIFASSSKEISSSVSDHEKYQNNYKNNFDAVPKSYIRLARSKSDLTVAKPFKSTKPDYLKKNMRVTRKVIELRSRLNTLNLVTVCQEASCPNISECWSESTATFMIGGDICTRACGFCNVKTGKPNKLDNEEPLRVAQAVKELNLKYVVITSVDRDDLDDLGVSHWVETIKVVREISPTTKVEVLIPDFKGRIEVIDTLIQSHPDVINHNLETVARLHKAVRPSAGYGKSMSLLAQCSESGIPTKSGIMVGLGETDEEVLDLICDLAAIGVSIVTIGQYLRPTKRHLPVLRYVTAESFEKFKRFGESLGINHVEASPFTRSSYHAGNLEEYLR